MSTTELSSARLRLRPLRAGDEPALGRLFDDAEVCRYLWAGRTVDGEEVAAVVDGSLRDFEELGVGFWMLATVDGAPAGLCGFRREPDTAEVELIYAMPPELWGRGLATEAATRVLGYAFDDVGVEEVVAGTDAPNRASVRVLEKLGFEVDRRFTRPGDAWEQVYFRLGIERFRSARGLGGAPG